MIDPAPPAAALAVAHLAKSFDGEAILRDVSFSVGRGELLVLRGESGVELISAFVATLLAQHTVSLY